MAIQITTTIANFERGTKVTCPKKDLFSIPVLKSVLHEFESHPPCKTVMTSWLIDDQTLAVGFPKNGIWWQVTTDSVITITESIGFLIELRNYFPDSYIEYRQKQIVLVWNRKTEFPTESVQQ